MGDNSMLAVKQLALKSPNKELLEELKIHLIKHVSILDKEMKGPLIQGGNFRMDIGPTKNQALAFEWAAVLHEEFRSNDLKTHLCCILDDMRLEPEQRPRNANLKPEEFFPKEYFDVLRVARIPISEVVIFFEGSLRNWVDRDIRYALAKQENTQNRKRKGIEWNIERLRLMVSENGTTDVHCAMLFGKFYIKVMEMGYPQLIGFYEPRNTCGPSSGTSLQKSGYTMQLEVINYMVNEEGTLVHACTYDPITKITLCNPNLTPSDKH